ARRRRRPGDVLHGRPPGGRIPRGGAGGREGRARSRQPHVRAPPPLDPGPAGGGRGSRTGGRGGGRGHRDPSPLLPAALGDVQLDRVRTGRATGGGPYTVVRPARGVASGGERGRDGRARQPAGPSPSDR